MLKLFEKVQNLHPISRVLRQFFIEKGTKMNDPRWHGNDLQAFRHLKDGLRVRGLSQLKYNYSKSTIKIQQERCEICSKLIRTLGMGTQQQLTHPPVKSSNFPPWKNHVSQGLLFSFCKSKKF